MTSMHENSHALSSPLLQAYEGLGPVARHSASVSTAAENSSSAATRLTRPHSSAWRAGMRSPPASTSSAAVSPDTVLSNDERASLVPLPPGQQDPAVERWWGRHHRELRWQLEAARLVADPVFRGEHLPRGDGRAVLLLPGFLAGDWSLRVLAGWLRRLGYRPRVCGFWLNVGCSDAALGIVGRATEAAYEQTGRRVAVLGHSRGGHFAKAIAVQRPLMVSHAISMGAALASPLDISVPTQAAVALARAYQRRTSDRVARRGCLTDSCTCGFSQALASPVPATVRCVSMYSKGDGVVRWQSCLIPDARNVEISGSHVGMPFNRHAYRAIADELAEPEIAASGDGA
jgi:triacylglycerol lipase